MRFSFDLESSIPFYFLIFSSFISCTSFCTSSTTLRAIASLCTPPKRVWTLLTTPTSSHAQRRLLGCRPGEKSADSANVQMSSSSSFAEAMFTTTISTQEVTRHAGHLSNTLRMVGLLTGSKKRSTSMQETRPPLRALCVWGEGRGGRGREEEVGVKKFHATCSDHLLRRHVRLDRPTSVMARNKCSRIRSRVP